MMDVQSYIKLIGENLVKIRKSKNLKQVELANSIGLEDSALRRIEKGRTNPSIKTLLKICSALEVDLKEVLPNQYD